MTGLLHNLHGYDAVTPLLRTNFRGLIEFDSTFLSFTITIIWCILKPDLRITSGQRQPASLVLVLVFFDFGNELTTIITLKNQDKHNYL